MGGVFVCGSPSANENSVYPAKLGRSGAGCIAVLEIGPRFDASNLELSSPGLRSNRGETVSGPTHRSALCRVVPQELQEAVSVSRIVLTSPPLVRRVLGQHAGAPLAARPQF